MELSTIGYLILMLVVLVIAVRTLHFLLGFMFNKILKKNMSDRAVGILTVSISVLFLMITFKS